MGPTGKSTRERIIPIRLAAPDSGPESDSSGIERSFHREPSHQKRHETPAKSSTVIKVSQSIDTSGQDDIVIQYGGHDGSLEHPNKSDKMKKSTKLVPPAAPEETSSKRSRKKKKPTSSSSSSQSGSGSEDEQSRRSSTSKRQAKQQDLNNNPGEVVTAQPGKSILKHHPVAASTPVPMEDSRPGSNATVIRKKPPSLGSRCGAWLCSPFALCCKCEPFECECCNCCYWKCYRCQQCLCQCCNQSCC